MDATAIPSIYSFGSAEGRVADQGVAAAIVVAGVKVSTVVVFSCPVQLIVAESGIVKATKQAQDMGIIVQVSEVVAMVFKISCFIPSFCNSGIILPFVEQIEVFSICPIDDFEREVLIDFGDVTRVADALRGGLRATNRMPGVDALVGKLHGEVMILWHQRVVRERCPKM